VAGGEPVTLAKTKTKINSKIKTKSGIRMTPTDRRPKAQMPRIPDRTSAPQMQRRPMERNPPTGTTR